MAGDESSEDRDAVVDRELVLRGRSVLLRPPLDDDAMAVWEAIDESVAEVGAWMTWCHDGYRPDDARSWIRASRTARGDGQECSFVVTDAVDGRLLGACGLNHVDAGNRRANLGYWVRTSATGRGVATEAAGLVARFGLTVLGLIRVEISVATANRASQRVAEKVGASREGVQRNRYWFDGEPVDAVLYSLIPADLGLVPDGRREPR